MEIIIIVINHRKKTKKTTSYELHSKGNCLRFLFPHFFDTKLRKDI